MTLRKDTSNIKKSKIKIEVQLRKRNLLPGISTIGLAISLVGLLGLATMHYDTPYWILAVWMFINSFGSGMFQPPNTGAIMSSVSPKRRGVASSIRAFFNSTGMV